MRAIFRYVVVETEHDNDRIVSWHFFEGMAIAKCQRLARAARSDAPLTMPFYEMEQYAVIDRKLNNRFVPDPF